MTRPSLDGRVFRDATETPQGKGAGAASSRRSGDRTLSGARTNGMRRAVASAQAPGLVAGGLGAHLWITVCATL